MNFLEFKTWFNDTFEKQLSLKIEEFKKLSSSKEVSIFIEHILKLSKNGKRLRPYIIFLSSGMNLKEIKKHKKLLISIELLHLFALVHDDIMDNAETRHDVTCIHNLFSDKFGQKRSESLAILAGDAIFAWSYNQISEYTEKFPKQKNQIQSVFNQLILEVIHGQMIDVVMPTIKSPSINIIMEKMLLKTARYSFVQPMKLGFLLSGKNKKNDLFAEKFGRDIGLVFQMQDDLLDMGYGKNTGKKLFKDITEEQPTLISWFIQTKAKTQYQKQLKKYWSKKIKPNQYNSIKSLMKNSGAVDFAISHIENRKKKIITIIKENTNKKDSQKWLNFLDLIISRES